MAVTGKVEKELEPKGVQPVRRETRGIDGLLGLSGGRVTAGNDDSDSPPGPLRRTNSAKGLILINIIGRIQIKIARLFGLSTGHRIDKFNGLAFI